MKNLLIRLLKGTAFDEIERQSLNPELLCKYFFKKSLYRLPEQNAINTAKIKFPQQTEKRVLLSAE